MLRSIMTSSVVSDQTRYGRGGSLIKGCRLVARLSKGDLTETEWRVPKDLLPIEPDSRGCGRPPEHNRSIIDDILSVRLMPWATTRLYPDRPTRARI